MSTTQKLFSASFDIELNTFYTIELNKIEITIIILSNDYLLYN